MLPSSLLKLRSLQERKKKVKLEVIDSYDIGNTEESLSSDNSVNLTGMN